MRSIAAIVIALATSGLPVVAQAAEKPAAPATTDSDTRAAIMLDAHGRAALLEEMRAHVVNLQQIVNALARNDMAAAAKAARASGMSAASEAEEKMMKQFPKGFVELGTSMHRDFDAIAADAEKTKDPKRTLSLLSVTLQKCIGCHAAYQVRLRSAASPKK